MQKHAYRRVAAGLLTGWLAVGAMAADLPELNIDLQQTTVSGISSGAFMAVQMAVAKSASIKGVAATAGGPYDCALDAANGMVVNTLAGSSVSIARCMQGDPMMPAQPITANQLSQMASNARGWAQQGKIDPVSNLNRQAVWVFHGYNDGIVKLPVSQALVQWYGNFAPTQQIFHKDNLNAAHAQITNSCNSQSAVCNTCPTTGGQFLNTCGDQPPASDNRPYDAAGAALQMFYGPLQPTQPAGQAQPFSQKSFLKWFDGKTSVDDPKQIAMGDTGYVYVPPTCARGEPCRLHIAFHGCMQSATSLGSDTSVPAAQRNPRAFVDDAGVNAWADANHLVVLYPQAQPTQLTTSMWWPFAPQTPMNPMGCWDWWGYNDLPRSNAMLGQDTGTFATVKGVQIAAVWRMAEHLARKGQPGSWTDSTTAAPVLQALDQSDDQVLLRWQPVSGASGYRVYRSSGSAMPQPVGGVVSQPFWADNGLQAQTTYRYTVRAVVAEQEGADSNAVSVSTSRPTKGLDQCDPYFSLVMNHTVTKNGQKTDATCP